MKGKPQLKITVGKGVKRCRPFIAGFTVKGADLKGDRIKELMNFQEKLHETYGRKRKKMAIGIHDLDRIEGDVTYEAAKDGEMRPLGSQKSMGFEEVMKLAGQDELDEMIRVTGHTRTSGTEKGNRSRAGPEFGGRQGHGEHQEPFRRGDGDILADSERHG